MSTQNSVETKVKPQVMIKKGKRPFSLIIIGGGPAGLTAGIYAKRAMLDTLLIEKTLPGGLITSTDLVENYPGFPDGISGMELGQKMEEQAKKHGLDIIFGNVIKIEDKGDYKEVTTDETTYSCKTVIIASGSFPKKLEVPGEKELTGKGVSYCATCDGPFYKDKHVAVVGGGNAAIEEAIYLTKFAKLVTVIHRRDQLRADKMLQEKAAKNDKIFFKLNSIVEEIKGKKMIEAVKIKDTVNSKKTTLKFDGIFIYTGLKPNTDFIKDLVKLNENGTISTDKKLATNIKGIFAAGDVRDKTLRQVITGAADGAIAAMSVNEYLEQL